ncbi:hypothetical protein [Streptomyces sp. NPDC097981]|uniref:hypothetical protein n=1 Tax=Streptomyces sp. NPDC097981 TaxID=3155428 RepID=UPI003328E1BA
MTSGDLDFDAAWRTAAEPVRRALALAYEALAAGGLAVGAVLAAAPGPGEPRILTHHRTAEPETASLHDAVPPGLPTASAVEAWLPPLWPALSAAAATRAARTA